MRRYFMLGVVAATAALAVVGCGSDSDGGSNNTGGSGGGSSDMQCLGNNSEFKYSEFLAQTLDDKGCSSMSDVNTVCSNDMPKVAGSCGLDCLNMDNEEQCIATCIQGEVTHGNAMPLSVGCLTCYGNDIACARDNCLLKCSVPTSDSCAQCRVDSGCADAFYSCSGLPEPTSP